MSTKTEQIKRAVEELVEEGANLSVTKLQDAARAELAKRGKNKSARKSSFSDSLYQDWYTRALPVVRQLLPDRYVEFQELYRQEKRKEIDALTYTISDYLAGISISRGGVPTFDTFAVFLQKLNTQVSILKTALKRIDSMLADIRTVLQAELFDDEVSAAWDLLKKSHLRSSGAIAGVVIERHLGQVAVNHGLSIRKSNPTIADLNDALKSVGIYDTPDWRLIQRLGDIRNLCVHSKDREPQKDEVEDLVRGAEKIITTIF